MRYSASVCINSGSMCTPCTSAAAAAAAAAACSRCRNRSSNETLHHIPDTYSQRVLCCSVLVQTHTHTHAPKRQLCRCRNGFSGAIDRGTVAPFSFASAPKRCSLLDCFGVLKFRTCYTDSRAPPDERGNMLAECESVWRALATNTECMHSKNRRTFCDVPTRHSDVRWISLRRRSSTKFPVRRVRRHII